jgi:hypothetical protein
MTRVLNHYAGIVNPLMEDLLESLPYFWVAVPSVSHPRCALYRPATWRAGQVDSKARTTNRDDHNAHEGAKAGSQKSSNCGWESQHAGATGGPGSVDRASRGFDSVRPYPMRKFDGDEVPGKAQ